MSNNKDLKQKNVINLGSTTQAFSARFQQQRKLLRETSDQAELDTKQRQSLIMRTITAARRSLMDVVKIDMGDRFEFILDVDDWNGWPRVTIYVVDIEEPYQKGPKFLISAHERKLSATVEISPGNKPTIAVNLIEKNAETKFPSILRRAVRNYLDEVSELVLAKEATFVDNETKLATNESLETYGRKPLNSIGLFCEHETFTIDTVDTNPTELKKLN